MKRVIVKLIKAGVFTFSILFVAGFIFLTICYFGGDRVKFDQTKLLDSANKIEFYDSRNMPIKEDNSFNVKYVPLKHLPSYVPESFISIEDKQFYKHKGLNYKRIIKALMVDIKNKNMAQGASTISQQLIKNTHLSSQKTLSRKINEIILTKKLEKTVPKEKILENYLNIIYFGDNCYGIETASNYYFSKPAKDLTLAESCLLAGIISSPANYSPISKPEKALYRRNLVLKEMYEDKKIDEQTYEKAIKEEIVLNLEKSPNNRINTYTEACLDEAMQILKLPAKQISIGKYKIYTFFNPEKQESLMESLKEFDLSEVDFGVMSLNSKTGEVEAYYGKGDFKVLNTKRQPGSAIKPILVYAPALNEGIITPITQILDEALSISDYTPQNHDGKYHGYISVSDAVCKSYNIPAVKIMSYTGLKKSKSYAEECGIEFDEKDNNYAISLGGMTHGTTLKQLCGAYTALSNNGNYIAPKFIKYITDSKDRFVYVAPTVEKRVFRDDTAYLMNNILIKASKEGTSKRLSDLKYQIASKTGTVGKGKTNYDAWSISYTTEDMIGVWIGRLDNKPIGSIVGGTTPIDVTKSYFNKIYKNGKPQDFERPSSVEEIEIDLKELTKNHQVVTANNFLPEKYRQKELFSRFNLPKVQNQGLVNLKPSVLEGKVVGGYAVLKFEAIDYLQYEILEDNKVIATFDDKEGVVEFKLPMDEKIKKFTLRTKMKNYKTGEEFVETSPQIELIKTNNKSNSPLKEITSKWYI